MISDLLPSVTVSQRFLFENRSFDQVLCPPSHDKFAGVNSKLTAFEGSYELELLNWGLCVVQLNKLFYLPPLTSIAHDPQCLAAAKSCLCIRH